jgi:pSer/pThr/pTyr-binding forkhead associated (FHA) protein
MPKLILSMDGLVLKEIVLSKERTTIGRKPNNDVQIDNLAISGQHAVLTCILDDTFLEDLNSTNGTYVNGQPIRKHVLHNNDVIELGKYRLKYLVEGGPVMAQNELVDTAALKPFEIGTVINPDASVPASPTSATGSRTQVLTASQRGGGRASNSITTTTSVEGLLHALGVVQILSGSNVGRELELAKPVTTLGKPGQQVAVITRREQGYFLTHVEGATFPLVNGKTLDGQAYHLENHDVIEVAGVKMEFFLRG